MSSIWSGKCPKVSEKSGNFEIKFEWQSCKLSIFPGVLVPGVTGLWRDMTDMSKVKSFRGDVLQLW